MGNYVLTLHHNRCPDGAEFVPHPWIEGTTMRVPMKLIKKKGRAGLPEGQREWPVIRFRVRAAGRLSTEAGDARQADGHRVS